MSDLQAALPREMYVDEAAWLVERDAVLAADWTCVGRRDDLGLADPQRAAVVEVYGESVIVTSDAAGLLQAAFNVCRHRGSQIFPTQPGAESTSCAAASLRCPYHSWTYALDGSLLKAPHTEGLDRSGFGLNRVAVDEWQGFVFVRLGPGGALIEAVERPSRTLANYRIGELVTGASYSYYVAANWKVIAENYN